MKVLVNLQRLLAVLVGIYGALLIFSEVPLTEGILPQLQTNLGGMVIVALCYLWLKLSLWEEEHFIETGKKTF